MLAIADTCLLIDWANYRRRNILAELFHAIYVPEQVLDEVKSEGVLSWITTNFASGTFILFTPTGDIINEARRIIDIVAKTPWARKIELPEAILSCGRQNSWVCGINRKSRRNNGKRNSTRIPRSKNILHRFHSW